MWEAQVSSSTLAAAGLKWDEASHSLTPIRPSQDSSGSGPDSQAAHQATAAFGAGSNTSSLAVGSRDQADKRAAAAAAPAGEWESGDGEEVVAAARDAAVAVAGGDGTAPMGAVTTEPAERLVSLHSCILLQTIPAVCD